MLKDRVYLNPYFPQRQWHLALTDLWQKKTSQRKLSVARTKYDKRKKTQTHIILNLFALCSVLSDLPFCEESWEHNA